MKKLPVFLMTLMAVSLIVTGSANSFANSNMPESLPQQNATEQSATSQNKQTQSQLSKKYLIKGEVNVRDNVDVAEIYNYQIISDDESIIQEKVGLGTVGTAPKGGSGWAPFELPISISPGSSDGLSENSLFTLKLIMSTEDGCFGDVLKIPLYDASLNKTFESYTGVAFRNVMLIKQDAASQS